MLLNGVQINKVALNASATSVVSVRAVVPGLSPASTLGQIVVSASANVQVVGLYLQTNVGFVIQTLSISIPVQPQSWQQPILSWVTVSGCALVCAPGYFSTAVLGGLVEYYDCSTPVLGCPAQAVCGASVQSVAYSLPGVQSIGAIGQVSTSCSSSVYLPGFAPAISVGQLTVQIGVVAYICGYTWQPVLGLPAVYSGVYIVAPSYICQSVVGQVGVRLDANLALRAASSDKARLGFVIYTNSASVKAQIAGVRLSGFSPQVDVFFGSRLSIPGYSTLCVLGLDSKSVNYTFSQSGVFASVQVGTANAGQYEVASVIGVASVASLGLGYVLNDVRTCPTTEPGLCSLGIPAIQLGVSDSRDGFVGATYLGYACAATGSCVIINSLWLKPGLGLLLGGFWSTSSLPGAGGAQPSGAVAYVGISGVPGVSVSGYQSCTVMLPGVVAQGGGNVGRNGNSLPGVAA